MEVTSVEARGGQSHRTCSQEMERLKMALGLLPPFPLPWNPSPRVSADHMQGELGSITKASNLSLVSLQVLTVEMKKIICHRVIVNISLKKP